MIEKTYSFVRDGKTVDVYTFRNALGMTMEVSTHGGRILSLTAPDKNGKFTDVIVGYAKPEDYFDKEPTYFGALIGRYGNRIGKAQFTLGDTTYKVGANENGNSLHGGFEGFDRKVLSAQIVDNKLVLSYLSPDGEEGFPGNLDLKVSYALTDEGDLELEYYAVSDKDTVCNLTNHAYFNIGDDETILDQIITINSSFVTPYDEQLICHGELRDVTGTAFDLRNGVALREPMFSDEPQIRQEDGLDANFVIDRKTKDELELCATVFDQKSGRYMECYTTLPGVQLYTSNRLGDENPEGKKHYVNYCALCLESQCYPNSPNCPNYPTTTLKAGDEYKTKTVYKFRVK